MIGAQSATIANTLTSHIIPPLRFAEATNARAVGEFAADRRTHHPLANPA
jgi:hypothetical protein